MSPPAGDGLLGRHGWRWVAEPPAATVLDAGLRWTCAGGTDFWRVTQGHPSRHDGQALLLRVAGDFRLEGTLAAPLRALFDQAGFLVERDVERWVKLGVELDGRPWLGAVHTTGASDWSREPVAGLPLRLAVGRRGATLVASAWHDDSWRDFRVLHLPGPVGVGPYACAPRGPGFEVELRDASLIT